MRRSLEEVEQMMDEAIERHEHQSTKKTRHSYSERNNSGVRLRLPLVEVDDAESNRMVKGI